jgi:uncharacterized protein
MRMVDRKHFKLLYSREYEDANKHPEPTKAIFESLVGKFGKEHFHRNHYLGKSKSLVFPVLQRNGGVESSINLSETLNKIPPVVIDMILCSREIFDDSSRYLDENKQKILSGET